ncbi:MAG: cyclophilin-like fold protein [Selenomonadaceae bacterium]
MNKYIAIGTLCLSIFAFAGCGASASKPTPTSNVATNSAQTESIAATQQDTKEETSIITITNNGRKLTVALNDSAAAKVLIQQLPMTVEVKNFSDNEKLFYPKETLPKEAPTALATRGTLACFTPWGNLTIFYKDYGDGTDEDLIELGHIIEGDEYIEELEGQMTLEAATK